MKHSGMAARLGRGPDGKVGAKRQLGSVHAQRGASRTVRAERETRLGGWLEAALDHALSQAQQLALEPLRVVRLVEGHSRLVGLLEEAVRHLHHLGTRPQRRK